MAHVTALAQYILKTQPEKDAARLCLYHYLRNLCDPAEPIHAELLNRFFCRALTFSHWQENKVQLFQEVLLILQHFQEFQEAASHQSCALNLNGLFSTQDIQVVPAETIQTLELVINRYLERTSSPYDQVRLIREGNDKLVAITLQGDRSVRVTVYPKVLAIREGELVPLTQDFTLFYSPDLQLHPLMIQQLEVGAHTAARFQVSAEGIRGVITRGYTFQRYATMDGGSPHRYPVLFYPLKRLEQFFVNRKSDPMYLELTGLLEKALELTSGGHPDSFKFAEAALERGRLALEHIFPDDKLVRLLINNLEKTLALESARLGLARATNENAMRSSHVFDSSHSADEDFGVDLLESTKSSSNLK
jgi:hypothetical protein